MTKKRKYFTLRTVETAVPYHQDYRKNRRGRRAVLQSGITCKRSNAWLRFKWCLLGLQVTPTCTPIRPLSYTVSICLYLSLLRKLHAEVFICCRIAGPALGWKHVGTRDKAVFLRLEKSGIFTLRNNSHRVDGFSVYSCFISDAVKFSPRLWIPCL